VNAPIFVKTVRDQRRGLVGWSVGLTVLLLVEGALWPSVRDMPAFDELVEGYPEPMKELFDLDAMSTGTGFLNAELFTMVLPALFIVYAVARGARLVAGEEEGGTLEIVLVTPASTTRVLLEKAAGLLVAVLVLGLVCAGATLLVGRMFAMGLPPGGVLAGSLAVSLLGVEFGFVSLAVGAMTGRRVLALVAGGVAALAAYVLYVSGTLVDDLADWLPWSPFHQALAAGPIDTQLPASLAWLVLGAAVAIAAAPPVFARRDIRHA
jgi:ABC-2 type transport system permease protein